MLFPPISNITRLQCFAGPFWRFYQIHGFDPLKSNSHYNSLKFKHATLSGSSKIYLWHSQIDKSEWEHSVDIQTDLEAIWNSNKVHVSEQVNLHIPSDFHLDDQVPIYIEYTLEYSVNDSERNEVKFESEIQGIPTQSWNLWAHLKHKKELRQMLETLDSSKWGIQFQ
jgi:hypothetical protein